ncbi:MAG TPA: MDR family MFS transporter [Roseiflexaceae bacterium]|nr:MDR family MFS transporter [Roseiflexaceae bacterium]
MSRRRMVCVTLGVMLSLFLASMESTVVATAMPTIAAQLGGLEWYSWVFSAYMLASTTTVPLFGKLSDIYGRRPIYAIAMGFFLLGSLLCGQAQSIEQLIAFRAVQGLGAGGLLPLAFIIVGDLFTLEQRARMQGLFSGVWGVSSIVGPLLGGFLVDQVAWQWVFYINIPFGLLAGALVWFGWIDRPRPSGATRPAVDYAGATLLTVGIVALLLGLFELGTPTGWTLLGAAALLFVALGWVERRAADPVLPLKLFRDRMFAVACANGLLAGWSLFGGVTFVPLFLQAVRGSSATAAGATLAPLLLGWVGSSIVGSRLLLRIGYRTLALIGMALLTIGSFLMTLNDAQTPQLQLLTALTMMGVGMGLTIPSFLIAVQSTVPRSSLGSATSTLQFSRSIGGTLGVSVMGAALSAGLAASLAAAGLDPQAVSVDELLSPAGRSGAAAQIDGALRDALAAGIQTVFIIAFVAAALALLVTFFAPSGRIAQLAAHRAQGETEGVAKPATMSD